MEKKKKSFQTRLSVLLVAKSALVRGATEPACIGGELKLIVSVRVSGAVFCQKTFCQGLCYAAASYQQSKERGLARHELPFNIIIISYPYCRKSS